MAFLYNKIQRGSHIIKELEPKLVDKTFIELVAMTTKQLSARNKTNIMVLSKNLKSTQSTFINRRSIIRRALRRIRKKIKLTKNTICRCRILQIAISLVAVKCRLKHLAGRYNSNSYSNHNAVIMGKLCQLKHKMLKLLK